MALVRGHNKTLGPWLAASRLTLACVCNTYSFETVVKSTAVGKAIVKSELAPGDALVRFQRTPRWVASRLSERTQKIKNRAFSSERKITCKSSTLALPPRIGTNESLVE